MNPFYKLIEKIYLSIPDNLAYFDQMTKLHNRNYYDHVLKTKYHGIECTVIFADVNGLKSTNDEQGHHAGSKLLCEVADILVDSNANEVCRIAGDEFILIYTSDKLVCENFDFLTENKQMFSYGMYVKEPYECMSSAVKKADEEMYKMKNKFHENENNA